MIKKLIVTNKSALKAKYTAAGLTAILNAVARLAAADVLRGITTVIDFVNVTGEKPVKVAIDKLFKSHGSPDYLMILGGPDVIPFQQLTNPMFGDGDTDKTVPSDLPYASAAPHSKDIAKFVGPTRVVGRLADVTGGKAAADFVRIIDNAARFAGTPNKKNFSISADEWTGASKKNTSLAFGSGAGAVQLVPPKGPTWPAAKLAAPLHLINCHGADRDPDYFGSSPTFPKSHVPGNLPGHVTAGSVVAAECCYGAQLYKPTAALPVGIANTYLLQGAIAYCGSTNIAYGGATAADRSCADILCVDFFVSIRGGATTGRALLEARLKYVSSITGPLDPGDLKTLAQFVLLSDPSLRPFGQGLSPIKSTALSKSIVEAAAPQAGAARLLAPSAHKQRRLKLAKEGAVIAQTKPHASKAVATTKTAGDAIAKLAKSEGMSPGRTLEFKVEPAAAASPALKARSKAKATSPAGERIHVVFSGSGAKAKSSKAARLGIPRIRAIIARTQGAKVLSYKAIWSKSPSKAPS
jgi:hypothetical protein